MISPVIADTYDSANIQADWYEDVGMPFYADAVREAAELPTINFWRYYPIVGLYPQEVREKGRPLWSATIFGFRPKHTHRSRSWYRVTSISDRLIINSRTSSISQCRVNDYHCSGSRCRLNHGMALRSMSYSSADTLDMLKG